MDSGLTAAELMATKPNELMTMVGKPTRRTEIFTKDKKKHEMIDYALTLLEVDKAKTFGQELEDVRKVLGILDRAIVEMRKIQEQGSKPKK